MSGWKSKHKNGEGYAMKKIAFILVFVMLVPLCASCGKTIADENNCWFEIQHLTSNPTLLSPPCEVQFNAGSSAKPKSWDWKFSDGGTATGQNPKHTFEKEGSYSATMTATYEDGSKKSFEMTSIEIFDGLIEYTQEHFALKIQYEKQNGVPIPAKITASYPIKGNISVLAISEEDKQSIPTESNSNDYQLISDVFFSINGLKNWCIHEKKSYLSMKAEINPNSDKQAIVEYICKPNLNDKNNLILEKGKTYSFRLEVSENNYSDDNKEVPFSKSIINSTEITVKI